MNELKHWLDDASDADELERAVLRAGLDADPPSGAEEVVWSNLLGALSVASAPAVASGASAASTKTLAAGASKATAVWLGVGKGFVVGLAIYGAASGAAEVRARLSAPAALAGSRSNAPTPRATATTMQAKAEAPSPPMDALLPPTADDRTSTGRATNRLLDPPPIASERPSVAAFPDLVTGNGSSPSQPSPPQPSPLQAEAEALRRARAELRAGKLTDAFATLEASRRQFSAPALYQEREALLIELLFRSGETASAQQRAATFVERFPESPHTAAIRRLSRR